MAKQQERRLPEGWRSVKLGDVCVQDRQIISAESDRANDLPYLSLEHIQSQTGQIILDPKIHSEQSGKSSTFFFDNRHILYGKLRPYLNKVALPEFSGRCTTEAIPLLPLEDIDREFLAWTLRRDETVHIAMQGKTGSRMPRADMTDLFQMSIPLPRIAEQKRLVAILNDRFAAIETARKATEAQLEAAKALPAAYLREVFNSPEAEGWRSVQLADVADFKNGINFTADQKGKGILTVDVLNMYSDNLFIKTNELYRINIEPKEDYLLQQNDILFVRSSVKREGVGWTSLCPFMPEPISFCGFIIRVRITIEQLLPEFLTHYCRASFVREQLISKSGTGTITNISQLQLKTLSVPLPPIAKQKEIVTTLNDRFSTIETIRKAIEDQLEAINALPATLLRQAFNGEL